MIPDQQVTGQGKAGTLEKLSSFSGATLHLPAPTLKWLPSSGKVRRQEPSSGSTLSCYLYQAFHAWLTAALLFFLRPFTPDSKVLFLPFSS